MSCPRPFESGFTPVLSLDRSGAGRGARARWALGRGRDVVRIENGAGRAWEFDDAGRLLRTEDRDHWRQITLDHRSWGQKVIGEGASRRLHPLPGETDAAARVRRAHAVARALHAALRRGQLRATLARGATEDPGATAIHWLGAAAAWSEERLRADRQRIRELLLPVPVLPPDQYGALPIQLTEGCSWDRCTFCTLYRGVRYRERSPEQVADLLDALVAHLGPSVRRFRRLFLGQANALLLDDALLHAHLDVIDVRFPRPPDGLGAAARRAWIDERPGAVEGFSAFVDAFHRLRSVAGWRRLRERGLQRVHVGVESGSERLLRDLGKPVRMDRVETMLSTLHEAEVPAGLIFLAGAGGPDAEDEHVEATASLLGRLELRAGDQVFLSPLVEHGDADERRASLDAARRLRERLRLVVPRAVPIAEYDLHLLGQRTPRR